MEYRSEVALQRYSILMSYLQHENSSFWNRNNFFIVANIALLGFLIQKLPNICPPTTWQDIIIHYGYSIVGFILSILWRCAYKKSEIWIDHWEYLLKEIEGAAFGMHRVLRDWRKENKPIGAKKNVRKVWGLFLGLWIFFILYFLIAICVKCHWFQLCVKPNLCPLIFIFFMILLVVLFVLGVFFRKKLWVFFRKLFRNKSTNYYT